MRSTAFLSRHFWLDPWLGGSRRFRGSLERCGRYFLCLRRRRLGSTVRNRDFLCRGRRRFFGRLIVFGYTWALMHHMLGGIRHFVWDLGYGFKANEREALTWGALIGGIALTVLIWIIAYAIGGGR